MRLISVNVNFAEFKMFGSMHFNYYINKSTGIVAIILDAIPVTLVHMNIYYIIHVARYYNTAGGCMLAAVIFSGQSPWHERCDAFYMHG